MYDKGKRVWRVKTKNQVPVSLAFDRARCSYTNGVNVPIQHISLK